MAFFEGKGSGGKVLPYIAEFLWCYETGADYKALQSLPLPVWDHFQLYRQVYKSVKNRKYYPPTPEAPKTPTIGGSLS